MRSQARPFSPRFSSVQADWRAWLPEDKDRIFHGFSQELETAYSMLSISLNEAISFRLAARLTQCRQASSVLPELATRFTQLLAGILRALASHARHYGTAPNAAPLDPANFRGDRCQRAARLSALLSHIPLSQKSQYLHKVGELLGMVEDVGKEFCVGATQVVEGSSVAPAELWLELDSMHYDLNTCLRESIVLLKSFLLVLPHEELPSFEEAAKVKPILPLTRESRTHIVRNGRPASIAGE